MKIKKEQPEIPIKHYCCLYHFTNGKQNKSSTPCFNHVPLGVINPPPSSAPRSPRGPPPDLQIRSKQHEINFHTHDLNEIENKQSLPKRLAYPRVYVQQINPRFSGQKMNVAANFENFRKGKDFHDIFLMFKRYCKLTGLKTVDQVFKHIFSFAKSGSISLKGDLVDGKRQYFFNRNQFHDYLVACGFQQPQAQSFWQIAFNSNRFYSKSIKNSHQEVVSMRAFAYNYNKFYLQELQSYKNCLSEPALRQRMIDLRLFLQPWFTRNIVLKENHQHWKEIELMICSQLKRYGENELYHQLLGCIQLRNKIWLFMRVLAKMFYPVTDQKNIGLQVFNLKATDFILRHRENLQAFVHLITSFETHIFQGNRSRQEKIKVTQLLHFAKINFPSFEPNIIVYLRALFKYLYFFKKNPLLSLNKRNLNLDCSGIAEISLDELLEFVSFKQKEVDHIMSMVESICSEVNGCVDARPEIEGFKKFINQCNYLSECLLKMIRRTDFTVFYRLQKARELYEHGDISDIGRLKNILQQTEEQNKQITAEFWKNSFSFISFDNSKENTSTSEPIQQKNYINALEQYELLRKRLQGKLPNAPEQVKLSLEQKKKKQAKNKQKSRQSKLKLTGKRAEQSSEMEQCNKKICQSHSCSSAYCSLCDDICSTSVTETINRIDNMSDYLFDLLNGI